MSKLERAQYAWGRYQWEPGKGISFESISELVRQWAADRQIIQNSTAEAQLEKLEEERQETLAALADLRHAATCEDGVGHEEAQAELRDGYGDMLVCIINSMAIAGVDPCEALAHAYDQIKDRTGHLNAEGVFVKDE